MLLWTGGLPNNPKKENDYETMDDHAAVPVPAGHGTAALSSVCHR